jgi:hypothetical protein
MRYDFRIMRTAQRPPFHANRSALQRYLLALLVLGLLWLPLAGKLHQVVHPNGDAQGGAKGVVQLVAQDTLPAFGKLFSQHSPHPSQNGSLDCQVFDAHCFGLALSKAIPALPVATFAQEALSSAASQIASSPTRLIPEARAGPALI